MKTVLALILVGLLIVVAKPLCGAVSAYRTASACDNHGGAVFAMPTAVGCRDGEVVAL